MRFYAQCAVRVCGFDLWFRLSGLARAFGGLRMAFDDDVMAYVKRESQARGAPFGETLLRTALWASSAVRMGGVEPYSAANASNTLPELLPVMP